MDVIDPSPELGPTLTPSSRCRRLLKQAAALLRSAAGAFDLTSVLVGAAVVAILVGGAAAVVFGVIPYAQDQAAKQDLDAVKTSQGITRVGSGRFMSLASLKSSTLSSTSGLAAATNADGTCYVALSQSDSGTTYVSTSDSPQAVELRPDTETTCISERKLNALSIEATGAPVKTLGRMTTIWDTSLPGCSTITVPLSGEVAATINWGDGAVESVGQLPTHSYADPQGPRTVTIDGTFTGWVGYEWPSWSNDCLTAVTEWGETGTVDAEGAFAYTTNLRHVESPPPATAKSVLYFFDRAGNVTGPENWDMSAATTTDSMFYESLYQGDLSRWDTSNITNMAWMFSGSSFNGNINSWDTSKVTTMAGIFSWSPFNGNISAWDTSSVTNMYGMFRSSTAFQGDISGWDTSKVQDFSWLFFGAPFSGDVSNWDTSEATDLSYTFAFANYNRDLSRWNTSKVTNMSATFWANYSFNGDISRWNTSSVIDMSRMFGPAQEFNGDISRWNTANVTDMTQMFYYASKFNQDLSGWNTSKVTTASDFKTGSALTAGHLPPGALFR
jgi:surface protein